MGVKVTRTLADMESVKAEATRTALRHKCVFTPLNTDNRVLGTVKQVILDKTHLRVLLGIVDERGVRCVRNYGDPDVLILDEMTAFRETRGRKRERVRLPEQEEADLIEAAQKIGWRVMFRTAGPLGKGDPRFRKQIGGVVTGVVPAGKSHGVQYRIWSNGEGAWRNYLKTFGSEGLYFTCDTESGPADRAAWTERHARRAESARRKALLIRGGVI